MDYINLLKSGMTTEQAVSKLKLAKLPPTGIANYQYQQQIWKQEPMSSFKGFLLWYNNEDVSTLEALQKTENFLARHLYRFVEAGLYITKPGQHLSTQIYGCKILSLDGGRKKSVVKKSKGGFWWPFYQFHTQSGRWWNFIRKTTNISKSIVEVDASQLHSYSMCQPMPVGPYTRWNLNPQTSRFTPGQNKTRSFENMALSYFQKKYWQLIYWKK